MAHYQDIQVQAINGSKSSKLINRCPIAGWVLNSSSFFLYIEIYRKNIKSGMLSAASLRFNFLKCVYNVYKHFWQFQS